MTKNTKFYFKTLKKNKKIFEKVIGDGISNSVRQNIALDLTEIYFISKHIINLIEKISKTKKDYSKKDLDVLLGNLIDLRIDIYDELLYWSRDLKKPLKKAINKVEDAWYKAGNSKKITRK